MKDARFLVALKNACMNTDGIMDTWLEKIIRTGKAVKQNLITK